MIVNMARAGFRRGTAILFAVSLLAGALVITQQFMYRIAATPATAPRAEEREIPVVTLNQAQEQVSFTIPQPAWLPDGLALKGSHVNPPNWAQVFYARADGKDGGLGLEATRGARQGPYAFPNNARQTATVSGQPALYVHGAWTARGEWSDQADAGTLEWSAGGFSYHLSYSGLGLTRDELVRIAESVR
jgi:hypothetical protein